MPDETPLIIELEQMHDCISIDTCDKLRGLVVKWIKTVGSDERTVTNIFEVDSSEVKNVIKVMRAHKHIKDVHVLFSGPTTTQLSVRQTRQSSSAPSIAKSGTVWIEPTWSEEGVDKVTMIAPNFKSLKEYIDLVSEKGYDVKIKSKRLLEGKETLNLETFHTSGFTKMRSASESLTDRQKEVFDLACRYGYYEEPKKVSIEELAQRIGISESTCSELLRKAEKKLLPILNEVLRFM